MGSWWSTPAALTPAAPVKISDFDWFAKAGQVLTGDAATLASMFGIWDTSLRMSFKGRAATAMRLCGLGAFGAAGMCILNKSPHVGLSGAGGAVFGGLCYYSLDYAPIVRVERESDRKGANAEKDQKDRYVKPGGAGDDEKYGGGKWLRARKAKRCLVGGSWNTQSPFPLIMGVLYGAWAGSALSAIDVQGRSPTLRLSVGAFVPGVIVGGAVGLAISGLLLRDIFAPPERDSHARRRAADDMKAAARDITAVVERPDSSDVLAHDQKARADVTDRAAIIYHSAIREEPALASADPVSLLGSLGALILLSGSILAARAYFRS